MSIAEPTTKHWTRAEYYRLGELGWFVDQRTELIFGEIVLVNPQGFDHYMILDQLTQLLRNEFADGYWVRAQGPLQCGDDSEPEPDISVVKGSKRDFRDHPDSAVLVVEVSQSSLSYDRGKKLSLYARSSIPEYWIVEVEDRSVSVYRTPIVDPEDPQGHCYADVQTYREDAKLAPLEKPSARIAVKDIFDFASE